MICANIIFVIYKLAKELTVQMIYYLPVPLAAVQNERQPRSTAHVSLDSISVDTKKEHLATTRGPRRRGKRAGIRAKLTAKAAPG